MPSTNFQFLTFKISKPIYNPIFDRKILFSFQVKWKWRKTAKAKYRSSTWRETFRIGGFSICTVRLRKFVLSAAFSNHNVSIISKICDCQTIIRRWFFSGIVFNVAHIFIFLSDKVSSPPPSCQKIIASPTMSSGECVMAPAAPMAAPSEYPRSHSGALVSMNGGSGHSSSHAVINGSQPVLVVSYTGGMEPINIILQNQPTSGRIIAQAAQPVSSHLPGAVRSHALPASDYASIHTLQVSLGR